MNDISRRHSVLLLLLLLLLGAGLAAPGWAQIPAAVPIPEEPEEPEEPEAAPDSPRASVQAYLDEAEDGEWERAARYLALPESRASEGPLLARRLKAVLDTHVWFDSEELSPDSAWDLQDGLSRGVELVARIPVGEDNTQPVYMVRRSDGGRPDSPCGGEGQVDGPAAHAQAVRAGPLRLGPRRVVAGPWSLVYYPDFVLLMANTTWIDRHEQFEELLPGTDEGARKFGRFIRGVL